MRAPSSTELRRHLSFATRTPPAPRFVVTCRHLSFATRAPPSSGRHLSPGLHLRLPRLLHSMYFPFKPLPTTKQPFVWPLPPAPVSSPPSTPTIWELFHRLLQPCTDGPTASNRYQRQGALFLATTTYSGVIAPSAPTSWDIFRRRLQIPRR